MKIILASVLFSYYFIHIALIPNWIKTKLKFKPYQRLKPFDCITCLPVWIALLLYFIPEVYTDILLVCFASGFIGNIFGSFIKK